MIKKNFYILTIPCLLYTSYLTTSKQEILFTNIYINNSWRDTDSFSGSGSNLTQTTTIRTELPLLFKAFNITSLLDAPCGDFFWMKNINSGITSYIGMDIVKPLIQVNKDSYENEQRRFIHGDITTDDVPAVDMILCRDCLVHFSYEDIKRTIQNLKRSKSTYLLTTTFTQRISNKDIKTGEWRPLNLQIAPFNFPEPIVIINEQCTEANGLYADKSLALWLLEDL